MLGYGPRHLTVPHSLKTCFLGCLAVRVVNCQVEANGNRASGHEFRPSQIRTDSNNEVLLGTRDHVLHRFRLLLAHLEPRLMHPESLLSLNLEPQALNPITLQTLRLLNLGFEVPRPRLQARAYGGLQVSHKA